MPEHARLLRRPLPPKTQPSSLSSATVTSSVSLHLGKHSQQHIVTPVSNNEGYIHCPQPKSQNSMQNKMGNQTIDHVPLNVIPFQSSRPHGFPQRKPRLQPKFCLLDLFEDDPRFLLFPKFTLEDFLVDPSVRPPHLKPQMKAAVFSRCNYKKLIELFVAELQKSGQSKVNTVLISNDDIPVVTSRTPQRQILFEMAALIRAQMSFLSVRELGDDEEEDRPGYFEGKSYKWTSGKKKLHQPQRTLPAYAGAQTILNNVTSKYFQGLRRSGSPFKLDEENGMITPSELAILDSLVQGGILLSLKVLG
ncbi:uncharacterized protein LOC102358845 [Latimeria chalumnae]|uniref:uncharacterized protein LOC102358845 n=1 Tax=Latimeria chalumnae TaxID=7897 RepID=UPI00313D4550